LNILSEIIIFISILGLNEIKSTYESDEEFDKTKTNLNKIPVDEKQNLFFFCN
jgi:hypothetical protein